MSRTLNINLDNILFGLACLYAFFIPLEKVLEVLFGIDTVLKPYRVMALLMLGLFALKLRYRATANLHLKRDIFLYAVFAYGVIITLVRMLTTKFYLGYLYNDTFQLGLYLATFIVLRHINLSRQRVWTILRWLTAGIIINALYLFNIQFFLRLFKRAGGMMDNPNYFALSIVFVLLMVVLERSRFTGIWRKVLWWIAIVFLLYMLILAGSRISFAILMACLLLAFALASFKDKLRMGLMPSCAIVSLM